MLRTFEPLDSSKGGLISTTVHGDYCILTQDKIITQISLNDSKGKRTFNPGLRGMFQIMHNNGDDYIISDCDSKAIYNYNPVSQRKVKVLDTGGKVPWYMTKTQRSTCIICFPLQHSLQEYSSDWKLLRTIGSWGSGDGQLVYPQGITTTPTGHILVVDYRNHRINCFDQQGRFCKHILTQKDGLSYPTDVALCYPLLWITQLNGHLKCYEFK